MNEPLIIGNDGKLYTRSMYDHKETLKDFQEDC